MAKKPRIAVLFPDFGLIDGDLCDIAEGLDAEAVIFRVPHTAGPSDPRGFEGKAEVMATAIQSMGDLDNLERVARQTRGVHPDAVVWACTSGSFLGDPAQLARQIPVMAEAAGAPATTTSRAVLEAIRRQGITRACVITPYPEPVGMPFVELLERQGIQVLAHAHAGRFNDEQISALTLEDYIPLARRTWREGANGWVLPCTAVRVGGIPEWLEREYGVPVVMANPATIAHAVELARQHAAAPATV